MSDDPCAALYEAYQNADEASRAKSEDLFSYHKDPDGQWVSGSRGVDADFLTACSLLAKARDDAHQAWLTCVAAQVGANESMGARIEREGWMADVDTMTQAIHSVYCGLMADHDQPNEKDRDQARQLIAAIGQSIGSGVGSASA